MGRLSVLDTMNVKEHQNYRFNAYLFLIPWASQKLSLYHENSEENVKSQALKEKAKRCQLQHLSNRWYSENHSFFGSHVNIWARDFLFMKYYQNSSAYSYVFQINRWSFRYNLFRQKHCFNLFWHSVAPILCLRYVFLARKSPGS